MSRQSAKQVSVNPNVRCLKVYPVEGSSKTVAELKTVGLKLSRDQAIHLARVLLAVSQDWDELDITAYRTSPRPSDGPYQITVPSMQECPATSFGAQKCLQVEPASFPRPTRTYSFPLGPPPYP